MGWGRATAVSPPWAGMDGSTLLPSPHAGVLSGPRGALRCAHRCPSFTPIEPHGNLHFTPLNPVMHPLKLSLPPNSPFLEPASAEEQGEECSNGGGCGVSNTESRARGDRPAVLRSPWW